VDQGGERLLGSAWTSGHGIDTARKPASTAAGSRVLTARLGEITRNAQNRDGPPSHATITRPETSADALVAPSSGSRRDTHLRKAT